MVRKLLSFALDAALYVGLTFPISLALAMAIRP